MAIRIARADRDFTAWPTLLRLVQEAFAYMDGRIDPPSSMHRLTPASIAEKSRDETLFLATDGEDLVGCVFAKPQGAALYVSKFSVRPDRQGQGIGRRLMEAVERHAREVGAAALELETRIELTGNHATFAAMGYAKVGEHAHAGYARPTYISMRKPIEGR
jgi:GNAT superfamily N-acetyltransferase